MVKKWISFVIVTLLLISLIGIKIYPQIKEKTGANKMITTADHKKQGLSRSSASPHRDPYVEETYPFDRKVDEDFAKEHPAQFRIVKKMYYSLDFIDNAEGKYSWGYGNGENSYYEFHVDFVQKKNRGTYKVKQGNKVLQTEELLLRNGESTLQYPNKGVYFQDTIKESSEKESKSFTNKYLVMYNGFVTESEWFTLIYNNYNDWTYREDTAFDIPVYKIKGIITKEKSESLQGPFTMTVSKSTGALLDLKVYDTNNQVKFYVTVDEIEINQGIQSDVFKLEVSDSKSIPWKKYFKKSVTYHEEKKTDWDS